MNDNCYKIYLKYFELIFFQVNEMFDNFKNKLQGRIDELEWMDDEDKAEAKKKALQTICHAGYPDILSDETDLVDMYTHVKFL